MKATARYTAPNSKRSTTKPTTARTSKKKEPTPKPAQGIQPLLFQGYGCLCVNQRQVSLAEVCCELCGGLLTARPSQFAGYEASGRKPVIRLAQSEHIHYGLRTLQAKPATLTQGQSPSLFERAA